MNISISPITDYTYDENGKPAVEIKARLLGKKGKELRVDSLIISEELLKIIEHPEIEEGGFTRYGNMIKDPVTRFMSGVGSAFAPNSKWAKELDAKNIPNKELRIFDTIELEQATRKQLKTIECLLKSANKDFGVSKKKLFDIACKVTNMVINAKK